MNSFLIAQQRKQAIQHYKRLTKSKCSFVLRSDTMNLLPHQAKCARHEHACHDARHQLTGR